MENARHRPDPRPQINSPSSPLPTYLRWRRDHGCHAPELIWAPTCPAKQQHGEPGTAGPNPKSLSSAPCASIPVAGAALLRLPNPPLSFMLTGDLMTPILSTRHPWRIHFGETPSPATLPLDYDIVRVSMGLGIAAIDTMIDSGHQVGPLLCCLNHSKLLVPVQSGTAYRWRASHSECGTGPLPHCGLYGAWSVSAGSAATRASCRSRFWVLPPQALASATTEPAVFHERLSLKRAEMRDARCWREGALARQAFHV